MYTVEYCLLGAVAYGHSGICDNTVLQDIRYVLWGHDEHHIGPFLACFIVTLTYATKIFSKCGHPNFHSVGVVHEALVATDQLPGCGVNHWHCIMFVVDGWGRRWA